MHAVMLDTTHAMYELLAITDNYFDFLLKALYQYIRDAYYYFKHLKSTAQRDVMCTQAQAVSLAAWLLPRPHLLIDRA